MFANMHPVRSSTTNRNWNQISGIEAMTVQSDIPFMENLNHMSPEAAIETQEYHAPEVLFFFDKESKRICIYDCKSQMWTNNDVRKATLINETDMNMDVNDKQLFIEEMSEECHNYSMIATNPNTIHIVGKYHIIYDIPRNTLRLKAIMHPDIANPCLCANHSFVFAISGRRNSEYTTSCKVYSIRDGTWSSLPDLPEAHAYGSAICFNDGQNQMKLMVIGGFERRVPIKYNQEVSIMDLQEQVWKTEFFATQKGIPNFLQAPMIQTHEGVIYILGSKDGSYYKVDWKKNRFILIGKMVGLDGKNKRRNVCCSINNKNEVFVLIDSDLLEKNLRPESRMSSMNEISAFVGSPKLDEDATYCVTHFPLGSDPSHAILSTLKEYK